MTLDELVSLLKGWSGTNWVRQVATPARDLPPRQRTLENVIYWSYVRWGRIVNVASVAGRVGVKYGAAYVASKHGLLGLTRTVALEGARKGVTANAICPSWNDTRMMAEAVQAIVDATGRTPEEARAAVLAESPRGQPASPEEVAEVAVWLASNPAVNGQAFNVDGGEVMS